MTATAPVVPHGYCHCGCGQQTRIAKQTRRTLAHVRGEPLLYLNGHNRRSSPVDWLEEDCGYDTPCWVWQLSRFGNGYGQARTSAGLAPAHRVIYERMRGPITPGLELDHLCRNKVCVNPAHLEPVTHAENMRRSARATLTWQQAREIRASTNDALILAQRYGVSRRTIYNIRNGTTWKEAA